MSIDFDQLAQEPKKASNSNGSMERHSLADMMEAERYEASKKAAKSKSKSIFAMGNSKAIPPGAR